MHTHNAYSRCMLVCYFYALFALPFQCTQFLQIMMFDIDQSVARLFTKDTTRFPLDSDVTSAAGIDCLLPGSKIQEFCFEPCGYSMNGLLYDAYWTIHITPESSCSYASFETNIRMSNYDSLIRAVLSIFRPQRYTMTLFADEYGLRR
jgi:S-adenosylmethionine decarboxylase